MPEEESSGSDLERLLEHLDDYALNVHNYQSIQNALESEDTVEVHVFEKLLSICVRDLKDDMKNSVNMLNILAVTLKKIKTMQLLPDLVPSALAVLNILKTTALFNKVEALKALCFDIIATYPDETLIFITVNHSDEIMELFNLYCHQRIPIEIRLQPLSITIRLLKILPPDKKAIFVKEGINIWFSKIIPMISISSTIPIVLDTLELLTEELIHIDYADNSQWRVVLECIYTPQKYPALMKNLLEMGNDNWHRLWVVFIKLLKNQITKSTNTVGSPINSMLPVVEMAFKMDVTNRCRAFSCWNVLIDNFSTETNEVYINKRVKLLIIPLTSNNAKVEETAIAKLKTWWRLISRFYSRMDKFADIILIPFLHFCFGKVHLDKPIIIPGMISDVTKVKVVQAFINILGHTHCDGCVTLPKLKGSLISTKLLVSHWKDWIHALNIVIKICAESSEFSEKHVKCFWKSFVMTVGELPENNIRRDVFNEVLGLMKKLAVGCSDRLAEIIIILILILFDKDDKIKSLLKYKDEQNAQIHKIVAVILKLPLSNLENRQLVIQNLKVLCSFLVEEALTTSRHTIESVLKYLPQNGMLLWIAFADSISDLLYTSCSHMLCKMLLWPFQFMDVFVKEKLAILSWLKLYKCAYVSLYMTNINEDIIKKLEEYHSSKSSNVVILSMAIEILHQKLEVDNDSEVGNEADFLLKSIGKMDQCDEFASLFPSLVQVVVLMLKKMHKPTNAKTAESALSIIAIILKLCPEMSNECGNEEDILNHMESLFNLLESVLTVEANMKLKPVLLDSLKSCASYLKKRKVIKDHVLAIYKNKPSNEENIENSVKDVIKIFEDDDNDDKSNMDTENVLIDQSKDKVNFTTPNSKTLTKKHKKKESNIVNTVMENGEEYVVVKSNWKFNPKNLTDNQKEKLQRKREDIPALYQDLSQSQDEFKLTTWKTDSQDTTTTTSKSTSEQGKEDVSSILKNIPNSEFVPKILQNIMGMDKAEGDQNTIPAKENTEIIINKEDPKNNEINKLQITVKDTKSPRLALKDRVFRNVRNLIEKSNLSKATNDVNSTVSENMPKTPSIKIKSTANVINSAPTLICTDRPSRVKRKPKKFDDLELFTQKKRRHSAGPNDCPDTELIESNTPPSSIIDDPTNVSETPIVDIEHSKEINNQEVQIHLKESNGETNSEMLIQSNLPVCEDKNEVNEYSNEVENTQNKVAHEEKRVDALNDNIMDTSSDIDNTDKSSQPNSNVVDNNKSSDVLKSSKKSASKKSRIEKELAIDMVEGHPFLKVQSEKRLTRKAITNSPCTRKSLSEKCNKKKLQMKTPKSDKKTKDKERSISIKETQNTNNEDTQASQDVIESSQDSTITTVSVKASKCVKSILVSLNSTTCDSEMETQNLLEDSPNYNKTSNIDENIDVNRDDTDLPPNKTVDDKISIDLTENMDTQSINNNEVILINDDDDQSISIIIDDEPLPQSIQNTAEADTQSIDPYIFTKEKENNPTVDTVDLVDDTIECIALDEKSDEKLIDNDITNASLNTTSNDETKTMSESVIATIEKEDSNTKFNDEEQRKQDFLINTLEISPIKTLSPVRDKKSPSPETSSDYVVIKLSSPVQSNGEPFEKIESPEFFTEEKISPDKRDQSPPREEVNVTNTSPSSSLSLKKNRPQVRSGGRAAQMLGLCVPDRLQTIMMSEKTLDSDENKKSPSLNTSARRNLRILYNSSSGETHDNPDEPEDNENFLKFKRNLPSTDSSPSGPILKRKLVDITDETTASPASKRKRVSFHDPPVSTTICVKKYIEPCGVRSPQNSAIKRQERQLRSQLPLKSPKKLENVFKLDSVLTKAVESFTETNVSTPANTNEDSEMSSIEQTPIVQVIKTTDLNDTDPICPKLIDCNDPIANIASELSSPAMKVLLIKEFEGKINTIGDLAKLTELEINRLCIKAPKVQVVERVLSEYLKKLEAVGEISPTIEAMHESTATEKDLTLDVQTEAVGVENIGIQTDVLTLSADRTNTCMQTDAVSMIHSSAQTDESGCKTTAEIVTSCMSERTDFVANLSEKMDEESKKKIVHNLSFNALSEILLSKLTEPNSDVLLDKVLEQRSSLETTTENNKDGRLSFIQNYLYEKFDSKDLILFCSDLLKNIYEKPS